MKTRQYHGWIYIEKAVGFKDHFSVQWNNKNGIAQTKAIGYGKAAEAVDHFETTLKLGPIKLEPTPIGLRVFTEKQGETTTTKARVHDPGNPSCPLNADPRNETCGCV